MKRLTMVVVVLGILAFAGAVSAQENRQDLHWKESPIWGTWNLNMGVMIFEAKDYKTVYGSDPIAFYNMDAGLKLIHELELTGTIGYGFAEGHGVSPRNDETTAEKYKLHVAPAGLGLAYRFNFVLDQPVVPYLGAGGLFSYWMEERLDSSWKRKSYNYGAYGKAGLMILLDYLETRASGALEADWGINNTYLFYEYRYNWLNNFDDEDIINLNSQLHTLGLLFEF